MSSIAAFMNSIYEIVIFSQYISKHITGPSDKILADFLLQSGVSQEGQIIPTITTRLLDFQTFLLILL